MPWTLDKYKKALNGKKSAWEVLAQKMQSSTLKITDPAVQKFIRGIDAKPKKGDILEEDESKKIKKEDY